LYTPATLFHLHVTRGGSDSSLSHRLSFLTTIQRKKEHIHHPFGKETTDICHYTTTTLSSIIMEHGYDKERIPFDQERDSSFEESAVGICHPHVAEDHHVGAVVRDVVDVACPINPEGSPCPIPHVACVPDAVVAVLVLAGAVQPGGGRGIGGGG
jgi:hypothetical protein